ncbi:MAG: YbaB/EbfC family nucleoid-associated protein, partial [Erysipelotrichaceae bacterium]|nr:YbaB/EbfC family nucleoid-associated protein [Erysipelotrichaceae bacterium]
DVEMIEDLVMIAVNDAIAKADNLKKERFGSMASAMGLPMK